jgi:hypothetical protein
MSVYSMGYRTSAGTHHYLGPPGSPKANSLAPTTGSEDTLLIIKTEDQSFRGKTTRATALKIAQFILAAPEKVPNQQPSGEGEFTANAACGDSQAQGVDSSVATQPDPPNGEVNHER